MLFKKQLLHNVRTVFLLFFNKSFKIRMLLLQIHHISSILLNRRHLLLRLPHLFQCQSHELANRFHQLITYIESIINLQCLFNDEFRRLDFITLKCRTLLVHKMNEFDTIPRLRHIAWISLTNPVRQDAVCDLLRILVKTSQ